MLIVKKSNTRDQLHTWAVQPNHGLPKHPCLVYRTKLRLKTNTCQRFGNKMFASEKGFWRWGATLVQKPLLGLFTTQFELSQLFGWIKPPRMAFKVVHDGFTLRPECNLLDCFVLKRWRCPIRGRLKTWGNIQNKNMEWKAEKSLQYWRKKTENYKSPTCISWSQNKKRLSNLWGSGISWKLRWLNVFSFWDESTFPFFETTPRASTKR